MNFLGGTVALHVRWAVFKGKNDAKVTHQGGVFLYNFSQQANFRG